MILASTNVPILKMSANLFYDPHINVPIQKSQETYLMLLVSISTHTKKSGNLFNDPRINEPI